MPPPLHDGEPIIDMPGFAHRFADVNGARIHYVAGGVGPLVVLLHGWPFNSAEFRRLMPMLARQGYRVIAPDLRGFGLSATPEDKYAKADCARDLQELVRSLGENVINLLGSDIGGMVAYAYAARDPSAVRRLVVAETLLPGFGLEERMNPASGGYWHFGFHMQVQVATMLTQGKEAAYLMPMWSMMSVRPDAETFARTHYLPYFEQPGAMRAGFKHYEALLDDGRHNRQAFSGKLSMPVLVLSGAKGIPHDQTLECVERVASDVTGEIVPDAGHCFAQDNPAWVAERLARFLA